MKFRFKIQEYQTEAVENTVGVFTGQPSKEQTIYHRDLGQQGNQMLLEEEYVGYRNHDVELTDIQLLENIRKIQIESDIPQSAGLVKENGLGSCSLDIEMETGTGKTYVYIKTMFEMNKQYGWTKFIVVVPSIAIREGVYKSFTMLEDHFMEQYGKKARYFIYNSSNLTAIDNFSSDACINVMIINVQAFNTSFKEGGKNNESRIIYSERDNFQSRRPIDVIAANRPIIIMDEPQKMGGTATQNALKNFKPLFVLNYSATHRIQHNCIYALDALDAYKKKLVKKIQVKGVTQQNLRGAQSYIYFDSIVLSKDRNPQVKLEIEVEKNGDICRKIETFEEKDKLADKSDRNAYQGYTITEIRPEENKITFQNGIELKKGEVIGDENEADIQRIQIRETIKSHFEKEQFLYKQGIKTLSLFFIDEVANYKSYDANGEEIHGPLWKIFEEEYSLYWEKSKATFEEEYRKYLENFNVGQVHNGYFSIDKKSGHVINSEVKRGEDFSNDISAYDLILRNKERLLSFEEPTRFIFSHSALREGWDNPNVFQICTLRHANAVITRRQEVGRGLRLCVDQEGNRMDSERLGDSVHDINKLTVIANESYSDFVSKLQSDTEDTLRERPKKADKSYFEGLTVLLNNETHIISGQEAASIESWLYENDYVDEKGNITQSYHNDLAANKLAGMSKKLAPMKEGILKLIQSIYDPSMLNEMIEDANGVAEVVNEKLNHNAEMKQFKDLWNEISRRYVYTVQYKSEELIEKSIKSINDELKVKDLKYIVTTGVQDGEGLEFTDERTETNKQLSEVCTSTVSYDLVGDIAKGATLKRSTVVEILKGIKKKKLLYFKNNPEEFIYNVIKIIREQKATMIVEHIEYKKTGNTYDVNIFTKQKNRQSIKQAYSAKKHILNYVFTDSQNEKKFAQELDAAEEVCVYAKLPRTFQIPTPVGHYAPDWAIAFNDNKGIKHIFFIAETKGSMDTMQLRRIEEAKIKCAEQLFNKTPESKVRYHKVTSYQNLLDEMKNID